VLTWACCASQSSRKWSNKWRGSTCEKLNWLECRPGKIFLSILSLLNDNLVKKVELASRSNFMRVLHNQCVLWSDWRNGKNSLFQWLIFSGYWSAVGKLLCVRPKASLRPAKIKLLCVCGEKIYFTWRLRLSLTPSCSWKTASRCPKFKQRNCGRRFTVAFYSFWVYFDCQFINVCYPT